MAKNTSTVYLGYVDEAISTKYQASVDYRTNKIGGKSDFPFAGISIANCPICGRKRPLLVQIYAPLDKSAFHRTLYVYACLNPACSVQSRSWLCLRSQVLEKPTANEREGGAKKKRQAKSTIEWCSGADNWGDPAEEELLDNDPFVQAHKTISADEENGNTLQNDWPAGAVVSDGDDDSNSADLVDEMNMMQIDEENANCGDGGCGQMDGAIGPLCSLKVQASAEIEGDETELVTIDTPTSPHRDLVALLKQTSALNTDQSNNLTLCSYFITVDEEVLFNNSTKGNSDSEHVQDLFQHYQKTVEGVTKSPDSPSGKDVNGAAAVAQDMEMYERDAPLHGDLLAHSFLIRIKENHDQILRYSRNASPLLISPLSEPVPSCQNCGGELICELQIIPTVIPTLRLECNDEVVPIEFGNVLVYTCARSCWDTPDKSRQEVCIVQREL